MVKGSIGRGLDTHGERSGGAGGVLGFVAADGVSEGVFGDGPGAVEGVAAGVIRRGGMRRARCVGRQGPGTVVSHIWR